jgi:membrane protein
MNGGNIYALLRDTATQWWNDKALRLGAALAFYTALSLSPVLLIVIAVSGLVFGREAARGEIVEQIRDLVGPEGAAAIEAMIANAWSPSASILAAAIGLVTLLVGATGVFAELQDALNTVWHVRPRARSGVLTLFKDRLLSLARFSALAFCCWCRWSSMPLWPRSEPGSPAGCRQTGN